MDVSPSETSLNTFSSASVAFLLPTSRGGESQTLQAAEAERRRAGQEGDRGGSLKSPAVGERVPWRPATHSPQQGLPGMCQALLGTSAFLWVLPVWLRSWWRGGQRAKRSGGRNSRGQGTAQAKARPAVEKPRARRERVGERLINHRLGCTPSSPCTLRSSLTLQHNQAQGFCPGCSDRSGSRSRERGHDSLGVPQPVRDGARA